MAEPDGPEIEVGAADGTFRHWLAAEAKRQGELHLSAQQGAIAALEARATAVLSWSSAALLALVTLAARPGPVLPPALAGLCLSGAALYAMAGLWPQGWHLPGYRFGDLQGWGHGTELQVNEATALGTADMIGANRERCERFARLLRRAWILFALSPLAGLAGLVLSGR